VTSSGGGVEPGRPEVPAIVHGRVRHDRRTPHTHRIRARTYMWLVDIDDPPDHGALGRIRPRDHFGADCTSLRDGVERFVTAQGESIRPEDRVLTLTNPRAFGHVFNPLTTYYCLGPDERLRWLILEIHNTYGERHAHLLHLDARGRGQVAKEFYVSPFISVDGMYDVAVTLTQERVSVAITLRQNGIRIIGTSFSGTATPLTRRAALRAAVVTPFVTHQVSARIRAHGIRLWTALPIVPRPPHQPPEGLR